MLVWCTGYIAGPLAVAFLASRVAFVAAYLADVHVARSLAWLVGLGCALAIGLLGFA